MFLTELRDSGIYDRAAIAFISDHGEMNGRRAMVDKGVYLYPDVLRVPFVIKGPAQKQSAVVKDSVSLLDLSRTLLDLAGIEPAARMDGISLVPALAAHALPKRASLLFFGGWHVGVNFACGLECRTPEGQHLLYAYNCSSPNDELYDLDADDAVNLISDPAYRSVRDDLVRRLGSALQSDPRWIGYWAEFRVARYALLPKSTGDMQLFTKPA